MQEIDNNGNFIQLEKHMAGEVAPFVFEKLMEIKGHVMTIETNINEILSSLDIARNSLESATGKLTEVAQVYARLTGLTETEVNRIIESRWQDEGLVNHPNRYWRTKEFEGWRLRIFKILTQEDRLMTLADIIETTQEKEPVEIKRLESAISNALTTGCKNGFFMNATTPSLRGRLYGIPDFFQNGFVQYKYKEELRERYQDPNIDFGYITEIRLTNK